MSFRSLPARFRKPSLLIIGCGDVGMRVVGLLGVRFRLLALTTNSARVPELRAAGVRPLVGNLDDPASLVRLAGIAGRVLHLAPPQASGRTDLRSRALLRTLTRSSKPQRLVYGSTTGVYGNHDGAWLDETALLKPQTERALRRVSAEAQVLRFGVRSAVKTCVLRIPGIYDTAARSPRERLQKGTPALAAADDVFTNHIHADDLAKQCVAALFRALPQRVMNVVDDTEQRMGDYFDLAASALNLPKPPRISRADAEATLSPMQMSFMSESRRLRNTRMKRELRTPLLFPSVASAFKAAD
jgi:nucleoside-diphosphate-sugar epimerase